jgi:hypothetical protein
MARLWAADRSRLKGEPHHDRTVGVSSDAGAGMMSHARLNWLCSLAISVAGTAVSSAEPMQGQVTLSTMVDEAVTLNEPVVFKYVVTNESDRPVSMDFGFDRIGVFDLEAIGPDGRWQAGREKIREGGSRTETFSVSARSTYSQTAVLNEWLDFSKIGSYAVTVKFRGRLQQSASGGFAGQQIREFAVQVLPRDEPRLRATCEALLARASACCTQDSSDAIEQLGSVHDVVAVPYLEAALASARTSRYSDVLVEIGGSEARRALERLSLNSTDWVAANAKAALKRVR